MGTRGVIPLWLSLAARGTLLPLYSGSQVLDFVPVDIAVRALVGAAEAPLTGPINVGTGRGTSLQELAARIRGLTGNRSGVQLEPARDADVVRFVADVARIRAHLAGQPPDTPWLASNPSPSMNLPWSRPMSERRVGATVPPGWRWIA